MPAALGGGEAGFGGEGDPGEAFEAVGFVFGGDVIEDGAAEEVLGFGEAVEGGAAEFGVGGLVAVDFREGFGEADFGVGGFEGEAVPGVGGFGIEGWELAFAAEEGGLCAGLLVAGLGEGDQLAAGLGARGGIVEGFQDLSEVSGEEQDQIQPHGTIMTL